MQVVSKLFNCTPRNLANFERVLFEVTARPMKENMKRFWSCLLTQFQRYIVHWFSCFQWCPRRMFRELFEFATWEHAWIQQTKCTVEILSCNFNWETGTYILRVIVMNRQNIWCSCCDLRETRIRFENLMIGNVFLASSR